MDLSGGLDLYHFIGLVAAPVFGTIIGLERQFRRHPAGLHTTALVALGSAAYVIAGVLVSDASGPARVAGLGFIAWTALVAFLVVIANVLLHICEHVLFGSKEDPVAR